MADSTAYPWRSVVRIEAHFPTDPRNVFTEATGTLIDSATALRIGLVSRVVPQAELMDNAIEIARQIASNGPLAVRATKRLVDQGLDMPLPQALEMDRYFMGLLRDSEDRIEGRRAFAEKRKPVFKGR